MALLSLPALAADAFTRASGLPRQIVSALEIGLLLACWGCTLIYSQRRADRNRCDSALRTHATRTLLLALPALVIGTLLVPRLLVKLVKASPGALTPAVSVRAQRQPIRVAVATFPGPSSNEYAVTSILINQLRRAAGSNHDLKVIPVSSAITEEGGDAAARALGSRYHADIVIWGWYAPTHTSALVQTHFLILHSRQIAHGRDVQGPLLAPISELDHFIV